MSIQTCVRTYSVRPIETKYGWTLLINDVLLLYQCCIHLLYHSQQVVRTVPAKRCSRQCYTTHQKWNTQNNKFGHVWCVLTRTILWYCFKYVCDKNTFLHVVVLFIRKYRGSWGRLNVNFHWCVLDFGLGDDITGAKHNNYRTFVIHDFDNF